MTKTSPRTEEERNILASSNFFKIVCGAGNEDKDEVRRLATIYTLSGANAFDVSASPEVVEACVQGIKKAYLLAPELNIQIPTRPFITVSVGMSGDHHVRKASINSQCVACHACEKFCPTKAISHDLKVATYLCIGCGHCAAVCPPKVNAISFAHNEKNLKEVLPACLEAGAENIELHAAIADTATIMDEWKLIKSINPNHFISMCLDRLHLSNFALAERIKAAKEIAGDLMIIQADGIPMSGGKDDFQTTLQAVAIADIIYKDFHFNKKYQAYKDFFVLLSGGTNGVTAELALLCDTPYHGLSIGTHARKIIRDFTKSDAVFSNKEALTKAISIASEMVNQRHSALKKYKKDL